MGFWKGGFWGKVPLVLLVFVVLICRGPEGGEGEGGDECYLSYYNVDGAGIEGIVEDVDDH